jgi:hypothetical protein
MMMRSAGFRMSRTTFCKLHFDASPTMRKTALSSGLLREKWRGMGRAFQEV